MRFEAILDHELVRKTPILRKGLAFAIEPLARIERNLTPITAYAAAPPVFANSLPKSGTHLLLQVTRALPGTRYLGRFIATSPSLTQRERHPRILADKVTRVLPGETLGSHLHYSPDVAVAMASINSLHLFIYRDPRDVITSEAYYLAEMNRWHRMHKHFNALSGHKARLLLALDGLDTHYPEANARLLPYSGWLAAPDTLAIRYESLVGPHQSEEIDRIVSAWRACGGTAAGTNNLVARLIEAIDPGKSHTFRQGGIGKWRRGMSDAEAEVFSNRLIPSLTAFGYSP